MLLNNEFVKNEIREEIKVKMNSEQSKTYGAQQRSTEREVHSDTGLPKRTETFQINTITIHLQELEEQQQRQPRASTRKEITKIRAELNDIENKSTIVRINESRSWFFEKINKIDKPLRRLIKKKNKEKKKERERIQINTTRN